MFTSKGYFDYFPTLEELREDYETVKQNEGGAAWRVIHRDNKNTFAIVTGYRETGEKTNPYEIVTGLFYASNNSAMLCDLFWDWLLPKNPFDNDPAACFDTCVYAPVSYSDYKWLQAETVELFDSFKTSRLVW